MEKLEELFKTPAGSKYAQQENGYKGVYKRAVCMFQMAQNEDDMQKAFAYIEKNNFEKKNWWCKWV